MRSLSRFVIAVAIFLQFVAPVIVGALFGFLDVPGRG